MVTGPSRAVQQRVFCDVMGVKVQESAVELIKSSSKDKITILAPISGARAVPGVTEGTARQGLEAGTEEEEEDGATKVDIHTLNEKVSTTLLARQIDSISIDCKANATL